MTYHHAKFWNLPLCVAGVLITCACALAQTASKTEFAGKATASATIVQPHGAGVANRSFMIGPDDILAISVWKEAELSHTVTVRPDGKISMALIGELTASGKTPDQLEQDIASKLKPFVSEASVTVIVQEIRSRHFSVLGNVSHPGAFALTNATTVLDAIALAGGFRDFAKQKDIYVLRTTADGKQTRFSFNYRAVIKGEHPEQNIELQPRDTVVVP